MKVAVNSNRTLAGVSKSMSSLSRLLHHVSNELGERVDITLSTAEVAYIHIGLKCWCLLTRIDTFNMLSLIIDSTLKERNSDET